MLDEVHLFPDGSFSDDVVPWLKYFKSQFGEHSCDKIGVGVGKEWHGGHQFATVEVDDLLKSDRPKKKSLNMIYCKNRSAFSYTFLCVKRGQLFINKPQCCLWDLHVL